MAAKKFKVTFWGVRGTYVMPGETTLKFGGNTPCIGVEVGNQLIVLDAGSGIANLGSHLLQQHNGRFSGSQHNEVLMIFSHTHNDHIQGFPFFWPIFQSDFTLYVFGPNGGKKKFSDILNGAVQPPVFPLSISDFPSTIHVRSLLTSGHILWPENRKPVMKRGLPKSYDPDIPTVEWYKSPTHPTDGIYLHKITYAGKSLVYATDTEGSLSGDQDLIRYARGVDLLIHDTTYQADAYETRRGWGHSTVEFAVTVARAAHVKRLALFHYDPHYTDADVAAMQRRSRRFFKNSIASRERQSLTL